MDEDAMVWWIRWNVPPYARWLSLVTPSCKYRARYW